VVIERPLSELPGRITPPAVNDSGEISTARVIGPRAHRLELE